MKRFEERVDPNTGEPYLAVSARGAELIDDPLLNKGTCFTQREREQLGLNGLLPPAVQGDQDQLLRAYDNFLQAEDDVRQYLFLTGLQDRNETLFCRLVSEHLEEMAPIIYTPTVGKACELYSHIYRRARGLYVCPADRRDMAALLRNAACDEPRVIVITDNEAILGIGDQGVGGMPIPIGKLALYSVGAGIHPAQCLPLDFDVGTDNASLLDDSLYLGVRSRRLRGEAYWALLDELVDAIVRTFPRALVQWEDFASRNAFNVLARYRRRVLSFNDDIQGTGAVVVAGIRSALQRVGRELRDERIVFYGAGASGAGSAIAVRAALHGTGVPIADLGAHVMCLDSRGLILADRPGLDGGKAEIAVDPQFVSGWACSRDAAFQLGDVVRHFRPTVLVGASGQPGAFDEPIVRSMLAGCARPIVLALSNPTSKTEITPKAWLEWTNGAGVIGTGSPFAPVSVGGRTYEIGQGNNAFIFPGLGLGATAVDATWLPDEAFTAAAQALFECTNHSGGDETAIYPRLRDLRHVSQRVAVAVACTLVDRGAAPPRTRDEVERRVAASMWEPRYLPYVAAPSIDNRQLAIGDREAIGHR